MDSRTPAAEAAAAFDRALELGLGVCLLGMHLGNGDLAIAATSRIGYKLNLISKYFKTLWLNDLFGEPEPLTGPTLEHATSADVTADVARRQRDRAVLRAMLGR